MLLCEVDILKNIQETQKSHLPHMMVIDKVDIMEKGWGWEICRGVVGGGTHTIPSLFYMGKFLASDFDFQQPQKVSPT